MLKGGRVLQQTAVNYQESHQKHKLSYMYIKNMKGVLC